MKTTRRLLLLVLLIFILSLQPGYADDDLDELSDTTEESNSLDSSEDMDLSDIDDEDEEDEEDEEEDQSETDISLSFGGYVKALGYWNQEKYSDEVWTQYQGLSAGGVTVPAAQDISGYNNRVIKILCFFCPVCTYLLGLTADK